MRNLIAIALLALPLAASAQDIANPYSDGKNIPGFLTVEIYDITVTDGASRMFFGLHPGGCLRGPAVFKDRDGKEILRLSAGAEFGSGCTPPVLSIAPTKPE